MSGQCFVFSWSNRVYLHPQGAPGYECHDGLTWIYAAAVFRELRRQVFVQIVLDRVLIIFFCFVLGIIGFHVSS